MPDVITLKAMRFHARIGILPHEAEVSQPVEVDLSVELNDGIVAPRVVDYAVLYSLVGDVMASGHIRYLEQAAERVATAALAVEGVNAASVAVRKPHVALGGPVEYAEVSIRRVRND